MKFFLDTAFVDEIRQAASWGILDGITTNPSHVAKSGKGFIEVLKEITDIVPGPVSAEVTATSFDDMMRQAHQLVKVADNIVIKIPMIPEGLKAIKALSGEGVQVNTTLCFNPLQCLLAAKAGATYVSPFIGRLDDIGETGMEGINQLRQIFDNYDIDTQILVASVRNPIHVLDAAVIGADVVTMPFEIFEKLAHHPLTDIGLEKFLKDWEKIPADKRDI
jgi:transaldolase